MSWMRRSLVGIVLVAAALVLVIALVLVKHGRLKREHEARVHEAEAGPNVVVAAVRMSAPERTLHLQGEARPFAQVTLYAKVSGYLKEMKVDKGDRVRAHQILAVIESPEIDRQERAAAADAWNKQRVAGRTSQLAEKQLVAAQDADTASAAARQAEEIHRSLTTQRGYEVLRAPFDGIIIARYADPGALIQSAAGSQQSALPIVAIAQSERLRVYMYVDQRWAAMVRAGQKTTITVPSAPERNLEGQVARTADALDPRTRMLLCEIDFDNHDRPIVPGSFVDVALHIPRQSYTEVPAEALVLRGGRTLVAIVGPDHRVSYREIVLADQDGLSLWISSGLREGELVALGVGESFIDGQLVRPVVAKEAHTTSSKR